MKRKYQSEQSSGPSIRDRALIAMGQCLHSQPEGKITMQMVAEQGGMSRATLYRHFNDRHELMRALLHLKIDEAVQQVQARLGGILSISNYIVEGLLEMRAVVEVEPALKLCLLAPPQAIGIDSQSAMQKQFLAFMQPMLINAQQDGIVRSDVNIEMILIWLLGVLQSLLMANEGLGVTAHTQQRERLEKLLIPALLN